MRLCVYLKSDAFRSDLTSLVKDVGWWKKKDCVSIDQLTLERSILMFMLMIVNQRHFLNVSSNIFINTYMCTVPKRFVELYIVYQKTCLFRLPWSIKWLRWQAMPNISWIILLQERKWILVSTVSIYLYEYMWFLRR